jgi:hypothetical protein
MRLC